MKILAIESSAKAASVALCDGELLLAQAYQNIGMTHSATLLPLCASMLEHAFVELKEVELIACAQGPGSFTGLRIGLSTAKGLAWPDQIPCIGVSTLESMAWNVACVPGVICCAMDARRKQVYNALFFSDGKGGLERLTEDRAISLEELFSETTLLDQPVLLVGDGAELCLAEGTRRGLTDLILAPANLRYQSAWGVARAALAALEHTAPCSGAELEANYLRLSQAERERNERLAQNQ